MSILTDHDAQYDAWAASNKALRAERDALIAAAHEMSMQHTMERSEWRTNLARIHDFQTTYCGGDCMIWFWNSVLLAVWVHGIAALVLWVVGS